MKKAHLYLLALALSLIGGGAIYYKWKHLDFPLQPNAEVEVWTLQARIQYQPRKPANTVVLQLPSVTPGFTVLDERFVARNYSKLEEPRRDSREVQWSIRRASGRQALYYRATVVRDRQSEALAGTPRLATPPTLEEPFATAAQTLLDNVRLGSSNVPTYAKELVRQMNLASPSEEVALLSEGLADADARAAYITQLLAMRQIPAG
jgi:hypothetical protein